MASEKHLIAGAKKSTGVGGAIGGGGSALGATGILGGALSATKARGSSPSSP